MPTFDPAVPRYLSDGNSAELRDNFNALNDRDNSLAGIVAGLQAVVNSQAAQIAALGARCDTLQSENDHLQSECDSLQAQITALTPHGHTASGFGDARANGTLTQIPDRFGSPAYALSGGGMIIVIPTGGGWELWEGDPNGQMYSPLYRINGADITGTWYIVTGIAPAGAIA